MIHLRSLRYQIPDDDPNAGFPFGIPAIHALDELNFASEVTFLVGENGSGKSTLLEALACAVGSIVVGSESLEQDKTLQAQRNLAGRFRLVWNKRTRKGFFLRAEDFFGYAKKLTQIRAELQEDLKEADEDPRERSELARQLERMPYNGQLHALQNRYGSGLETQSHGESFMALMQSRFVPGGLYLLDEPEAPLSPLRQLALISLLKQMVAQDAQFIIATHSPILLAYPNATILTFDQPPIHSVKYDDLEHVTLTRAFLNDPDVYLRNL